MAAAFAVLMLGVLVVQACVWLKIESASGTVMCITVKPWYCGQYVRYDRGNTVEVEREQT